MEDCRLFCKGPNVGGCNENWEDINIKTILSLTNVKLKISIFLHLNYMKKIDYIISEQKIIIYNVIINSI